MSRITNMPSFYSISNIYISCSLSQASFGVSPAMFLEEILNELGLCPKGVTSLSLSTHCHKPRPTHQVCFHFELYSFCGAIWIDSYLGSRCDSNQNSIIDHFLMEKKLDMLFRFRRFATRAPKSFIRIFSLRFSTLRFVDHVEAK